MCRTPSSKGKASLPSFEVMNPEVLILHKPLEHFDYVFARRVVERVLSECPCSGLQSNLDFREEILREFVDLRGLEKPQLGLSGQNGVRCYGFL